MVARATPLTTPIDWTNDKSQNSGFLRNNFFYLWGQVHSISVVNHLEHIIN